MNADSSHGLWSLDAHVVWGIGATAARYRYCHRRSFAVFPHQGFTGSDAASPISAGRFPTAWVLQQLRSLLSPCWLQSRHLNHIHCQFQKVHGTLKYVETCWNIYLMQAHYAKKKSIAQFPQSRGLFDSNLWTVVAREILYGASLRWTGKTTDFLILDSLVHLPLQVLNPLGMIIVTNYFPIVFIHTHQYPIIARKYHYPITSCFCLTSRKKQDISKIRGKDPVAFLDYTLLSEWDKKTSHSIKPDQSTIWYRILYILQSSHCFLLQCMLYIFALINI